MEGSEPDLTITSQGVEFPKDLYINGAGTWQLSDKLFVEDSLIIDRGNFMTNGHDMRIDFFISVSGLPRTISLGSSTITLVDSESYGDTDWRIQTEKFGI